MLPPWCPSCLATKLIIKSSLDICYSTWSIARSISFCQFLKVEQTAPCLSVAHGCVAHGHFMSTNCLSSSVNVNPRAVPQPTVSLA